jgi:hypothetical protein
MCSTTLSCFFSPVANECRDELDLTYAGCDISHASFSSFSIPNTEFSFQLSKRLISIMAGVAERARKYVERSMPRLREYQDKEIFTRARDPPSGQHFQLC